MTGPDEREDAEWPIDRRSNAQASPREDRTVVSDAPAERTAARRRGINPLLIVLGGLILLLLVLWLAFGKGDSGQDKLTGNEVSNSAAAADPEKRCASKQTYDLIKRELFRRAAQVRGSDQAAFDRLSAYAVLRMENPVLESDDGAGRSVSCAGSLSLDLPPGVAVVGGRRTLTSDVNYTLRPAADGSGDVVLLSGADSIITPLATLARTSPPVQEPVQPDAEAPADQGGVAPSPPAAPQAPSAPNPPPPESANARPSFNCGNARTRGELAVCRDSGLASLDRQMASQFNDAMSDASAGERALLQQTRSRFLAYRDRCGSDACIAEAYRGRMREIRDIMSGRWRPE